MRHYVAHRRLRRLGYHINTKMPTRNIRTLCLSGLRGWTQVPLARAAWVQTNPTGVTHVFRHSSTRHTRLRDCCELIRATIGAGHLHVYSFIAMSESSSWCRMCVWINLLRWSPQGRLNIQRSHEKVSTSCGRSRQTLA